MTRNNARDEKIPAAIRIGREHDGVANRWRPIIEITHLPHDGRAVGEAAPILWVGPRWYATEAEAMRNLYPDVAQDPAHAEETDLLRAVRQLAGESYGPLAGMGTLQ